MIYNSEKLIKFGKNLAKYRKLKHLSQNALAEILDVSREHLAKVETAKRGISIELLFKISEVLEIDEKRFFEFD
ncbi:helix-turn-helix transcriptional regulator [bacterium]|nr:helix-turn-helix transcriptional regulator [bacterium]